MPTNIEIKAKTRDPVRQQQLAAALATAPVEVLNQIDTFFHTPTGRLKLRELSPAEGQLIQYNREDSPCPKSSTYLISRTDDPATLQELLSRALGIRGQVRKHRIVYHVAQTRIHFDQVDDLGSFIELEVVLRPDQTAEAGDAIARHLMQQLEIRDDDLVTGAYMDLLLGTG